MHFEEWDWSDVSEFGWKWVAECSAGVLQGSGAQQLNAQTQVCFT